jgi:hypothetical protein
MHIEHVVKRDEISFPVEYLPTHHQYRIIPVTLICLVLAWATVLLRVVTRVFVVRSLGKDDSMMIATLVSSTSKHLIVIKSNMRGPGCIHSVLRINMYHHFKDCWCILLASQRHDICNKCKYTVHLIKTMLSL